MNTQNDRNKYGQIQLSVVSNQKQLKQFIQFPYTLYQRHEYYVPPLRSAEKALFNSKSNLFLHSNPHQFFLAFRYGRVVARVSAHLNQDHERIYSEKCGFLGFFECINNQRVANAILNSAVGWLKDQDVSIIRGPVNFTMNDSAGFLSEGFKYVPAVYMPYNPPYYETLWRTYGFSEDKQLYAWHFDINAELHPLVHKIADTAARTPGLVIRKFERKNFTHDLKRAWTVYKRAWKKDWGNYPPDWDEFYQKSCLLEQIAHDDFVWLAELNDEPVGVGLAVPDINDVLKTLKGRLWPLSYWRLWRYIRHPRSLRVLVLELDREFQDSGIDALLYKLVFTEAKKHAINQAEVSYIQDTNHKMNKLFAKSGGQIRKKYKIYHLILS